MKLIQTDGVVVVAPDDAVPTEEGITIEVIYDDTDDANQKIKTGVNWVKMILPKMYFNRGERDG